MSGVVQELVLDRFEDIKAALSRPDLSRGIDTRSYEEGNPRAGIRSLLHGPEHRARRHLTNPPFHRRHLVAYERERCVHETLRLRPTTPRIKRVAVADAEVAGHAVPAGARVVLDVTRANRDPALFGADADRYDPDRAPAADAPLWGLSFGAGAHTCIGRSVAGGFPVHSAPADPHPAHLHGLVAAQVHAIAARRPALDPADPPELDRRTDRGTRWSRFPVVFEEG